MTPKNNQLWIASVLLYGEIMIRDQSKYTHTYAKQLKELCSLVKISPLKNAKLAHLNQPLLAQLELEPQWFNADTLINDFGNPNSHWNKLSVAQKYGGHQFGGWNPDLGDGRGLLLGEVNDTQGKHWDLHLKGAGPTPYSRSADGRAVLRSTIREYLASEALHYLGIPTSRALCLITSEEAVYREKVENGAMMIRACQSHIRFGHFEYYYHTQQHDRLERLFNYCFEHHFVKEANATNKYLAMLENIVLSTAELIAQWQAYGFNHGVMNTDNMSIHGITFDYGPYAFLDDFDPQFVCNHSDHTGRYAFDRQPGIALWNLNALAQAFVPYATIDEIQACLALYEPRIQQAYAHKMLAKMGLTEEKDEDHELLGKWLNLMQAEKLDYTLSMRQLARIEANPAIIRDNVTDISRFDTFFQHYQHRLQQEKITPCERKEIMNQHNPKFILRNYLAQSVIEKAEQGSFAEFESLLSVLQTPYSENPNAEHLSAPPPDWGKHLEISCSS
jgi:uncharacterized protein YdiU (UPF0061 family)